MKTAYDPHYDPMYGATPGVNREYPPSYWVADAGAPPATDGCIANDESIDVAIIGGGFTGLCCALFLAREYGIKAVVLEANQPGWGCTCRNGGQGHLAWGRLSRSQWVKRWGIETAKRFHRNNLEGFEVFRQLTEEVDCDPCGDGNLLVAHGARALVGLEAESRLCNEVLGYQTVILSREELHENYLADQEAHGALLEPVGIAVQPLKLAYGYLRKARSLGARVHPGSPVIRWRREGSYHLLQTPGGTVRAQTVVVATAGYTHAGLHPLLAWRVMPVMANSAVTRLLSEGEVSACRFKSYLLITDTRKLRYYYRFLPEGRLQIGTRSAITGRDAENPRHLRIVREAIARKFPALEGIKIDYFWSGWMDISHDMIPRITQPDPDQRVFYAQGYSGNGVSFSAYAAKKLSQMVAGEDFREKNNRIFSTPLPRHPLRPLRRTGLRFLYHYYSLLDKAG